MERCAEITYHIAVEQDALPLSVLATQVFLDTYAVQGIRPAIAREVRLFSFGRGARGASCADAARHPGRRAGGSPAGLRAAHARPNLRRRRASSKCRRRSATRFARWTLSNDPGIGPGCTPCGPLLEGEVLEGLWFDRTQEYLARRRGEKFEPLQYATREVLELDPLPCRE